MAIEPTGRVVLTAPHATPVDRLDRVVRTKARWIVERLRRRGEISPGAPREFVSGETFRYLGRQYRLHVNHVKDGLDASARLVSGRLVVTASAQVGLVRAALVAWYRHHAQRRFERLVDRWSAHLAVPTPRLRVADQHRRWGSCDRSGVLRLNWRIIQAPLRLVEYVVAHELVHLRHRDHTPAFWAALGRAMPDYERRREELRRVGSTFDW